MSNKRFFPLLSAVLATPTLTAAFGSAAAHDVDPRTMRSSLPPSEVMSFAGETLKAELLRLRPADKLAIAGDRIGASAAIKFGPDRDRRLLKGAGVYLAERSAAPRTNSDIPECHASNAGVKGAGATGSGVAPRTNTDIPECQGASARGRAP